MDSNPGSLFLALKFDPVYLDIEKNDYYIGGEDDLERLNFVAFGRRISAYIKFANTIQPFLLLSQLGIADDLIPTKPMSFRPVFPEREIAGERAAAVLLYPTGKLASFKDISSAIEKPFQIDSSTPECPAIRVLPAA
jgi:hypothetical protein